MGWIFFSLSLLYFLLNAGCIILDRDRWKFAVMLCGTLACAMGAQLGAVGWCVFFSGSAYQGQFGSLFVVGACAALLVKTTLP